MLSEAIAYFCYYYFLSSWKYVDVLHWKWIPTLTTPMLGNLMLMTPVPMTPMFVTPMFVTPMLVTLMLMTPVLLTLSLLTPVFMTTMPVTPMFVTPVLVTLMLVTPCCDTNPCGSSACYSTAHDSNSCHQSRISRLYCKLLGILTEK